MKKIIRWALIILIILLVMAVGGFLGWAKLGTACPQPEAVVALSSTDEVGVSTDKWLRFWSGCNRYYPSDIRGLV